MYSNARITKTVAKRRVLHDLWTMRNLEKFGWLMSSSIPFTSRRQIMQSERSGSVRTRRSFQFWRVAVNHHEGRYTESRVMIQLFIRRWILFLGHDREWNNQIRDGNDQGNPREPHRSHWRLYRGNLLLKARPKHTSTPTNSSPTVTLAYHQRNWIDVEPGQYDKSCFEVTKKMIRLLRHDPSLQYFEKKTEQSNSESWHRCFVQKIRLSSIGQFEHG